MLEARCVHQMYTMKLNGAEVICVFANKFQIDYYDLSSDQWSRFDFSCDYKVPNQGGAVITKGNTLYFMDLHSEGEWNNGGVCFEYTFPEKGKKVGVKKLKHFSPELDADEDSLALCGAVLVLPAYK